MRTNPGMNKTLQQFRHGGKVGDRSIISRGAGIEAFFFNRGRTWALLKVEGKTPVLKERLASLERMGDRIGEYFF